MKAPPSLADQDRQIKRFDSLARKYARVLSRLEAAHTEHLLDKVAIVLRDSAAARDSDIQLGIEIVRRFYPEFLDSRGRLDINDLFTLPRFYDMQRYRAHVQNDLGLFQASPAVLAGRKKRAESFTERFADAAEPSRVVSVFADESGKTETFLVFGSVWVYRPPDYGHVESALRDWREKSGNDREFHFSKLKGELSARAAGEFINEALNASPLLALTSLAILRETLPQNKRNKAIYRGLGELLLAGLRIEIDEGRLLRPINLTFVKDADPSADSIEIEDMKRQIRDALRSQFPAGDVSLDGVTAMESHRSDLIQVADLFTGVVSRLLNQGKPDPVGNAKERFTETMTHRFGFARDGESRIRSSKSQFRVLYLDEINRSS